jgi:hypothetical protein
MTVEGSLPDREGPLLDHGPSGSPHPGAAGDSRWLAVLGADVDPQFVVTFAALAMCHSDQRVHCGLSVVPAGRAPETIAASDDLPVRVDWLQREFTQGPAFRASLGEVLVSKDLAYDQRWPDFGKLCVAVLDLRAMVSLRVPMPGPDRARLNFYATEPTALDHLDVDAALGLARSAGPAIAKLLGEYREALAEAAPSDFSRIAVALGIVMARYRLGSSQSFVLLLQTAHERDRALLDVALEVVQRGRLPRGALSRTRHARPGPAPVRGSSTSGLRSARDRARHVGGPDMWRGPRSPVNLAPPPDADSPLRTTK